MKATKSLLTGLSVTLNWKKIHVSADNFLFSKSAIQKLCFIS
ncbi:hypothetical protein P7266_0818 [Lactococcus cremoris]|nr:hypothetical protein P7266_0818 [Lactococcus cremoris]